MPDNFNIRFYRDYQFWSIFLSISSLFILVIFAVQTYNVQQTLKAIEQTRQEEFFKNNFHISFQANPSETFKAEEADYDLKLLNKSSIVYKSLKSNVTIIFENDKTQEKRSAEALSFPPIDLIPSNEPISIMISRNILDTMHFNISETRKNIPPSFKPKYFFFQFEWMAEIGEKKSLKVIKAQTFVIKNLL